MHRFLELPNVGYLRAKVAINVALLGMLSTIGLTTPINVFPQVGLVALAAIVISVAFIYKPDYGSFIFAVGLMVAYSLFRAANFTYRLTTLEAAAQQASAVSAISIWVYIAALNLALLLKVRAAVSVR